MRIGNKNGATFVSVVGSVIFMTMVTSMVFSLVGNNGLLVNKFIDYNKTYVKTSSTLVSAANFLMENSGSEELNNDFI